MATNQRSILLQRAMCAEQGRRIAEEEAARAREALHEAHAAIRRLQHAAALSAKLNPCALIPDVGTEVEVVTIRKAVAMAAGFRDPHTGQQVTGAYWRELENEQ